MKGDFSRDTFDARKHFSRVLMQQGRVQLDSDWNEQVSILFHYLQTLAGDLIGPHGGPADIPDATDNTKTAKVNCGFEIIADEGRIEELSELAEAERKRLKELIKQSKPPLLLGKGRYYVDGVLAENPEYMAYSDQEGYPFPNQPELTSGKTYLAYLDVWERHLTYVEVEDKIGSVISIREVALGGPDTATRAQVVWQVKAIDKMPDTGQAIPYNVDVETAWPNWVATWQPENRGQLKARAINMKSADPENPCITPPESRYRGAENQLYRVEIHNGGMAAKDETGEEEGAPAKGATGDEGKTTTEGATFKWSRENGSIILVIEAINANRVTLKDLGRDARLGLQPDDWVEIVDDDYTLQNRAEPLLQVETIDLDTNIVTLNGKPASMVGQDPGKHPFLRRWDQREAKDVQLTGNGVPVVEGENNENWIELENGVEVQFQQEGATYRTGDYWLIPARTATGDVEWPGSKLAPEEQKPHGITHHYAPLWIISVGIDGTVEAKSENDCRRSFERLAKGKTL